MKFNIKDMVKDDKRVTFCYYKNGELIYKTECGFVFPVPVNDTGDGIFRADDKAIFYMRWIRKYIQQCEDERKTIENE